MGQHSWLETRRFTGYQQGQDSQKTATLAVADFKQAVSACPAGAGCARQPGGEHEEQLQGAARRGRRHHEVRRADERVVLRPSVKMDPTRMTMLA